MIGLVRVPAQAPEEALAQLEQETLARARKELGYRPGSDEPLAAALKAAGIQPFTDESVEKYQWAHRSYISRTPRNIALVVTGWLGLFAAFIVAMSKGVSPAVGVPLMLAVLLGLAAAIAGFVFDRYTWDDVPLHRYQDPIPTFVLDTAVRVKQAFPDAMFMVVERRVARRPAGDPFLAVVRLSDSGPWERERYYIEVWNEPKYTEKRQA